LAVPTTVPLLIWMTLPKLVKLPLGAADVVSMTDE
jgi:hypothetical protein